MNFGLNLYSIRKQIATPEDLLATAKKLKEMGYASVQFSGAPFDADLIASVSREAELPVVLTHVPFDRILNDTKALFEEHLRFGCRNVGLGSMQFKGLSDNEIKTQVKTLEEAGKRVSAQGGRFFYHNHSHEFCRMESGETIFDYILANTEHVNFTLDTYWLQHGGVSILEYIHRAAGRIACAHLKDYRPFYNEEGKLTINFAPVGDGNINWQDVIAALCEAGTEHFLVEQDDATKYEDPFGQVERSIHYLNSNFAKEN